jgi:hypothetical protein
MPDDEAARRFSYLELDDAEALRASVVRRGGVASEISHVPLAQVMPPKIARILGRA